MHAEQGLSKRQWSSRAVFKCSLLFRHIKGKIHLQNNTDEEKNGVDFQLPVDYHLAVDSRSTGKCQLLEICCQLVSTRIINT